MDLDFTPEAPAAPAPVAQGPAPQPAPSPDCASPGDSGASGGDGPPGAEGERTPPPGGAAPADAGLGSSVSCGAADPDGAYTECSPSCGAPITEASEDPTSRGPVTQASPSEGPSPCGAESEAAEAPAPTAAAPAELDPRDVRLAGRLTEGEFAVPPEPFLHCQAEEAMEGLEDEAIAHHPTLAADPRLAHHHHDRPKQVEPVPAPQLGPGGAPAAAAAGVVRPRDEADSPPLRHCVSKRRRLDAEPAGVPPPELRQSAGAAAAEPRPSTPELSSARYSEPVGEPVFRAPLSVYTIWRGGRMDQLPMREMLRMCGALEQRNLRLGVVPEPDTPSRGQRPAAAAAEASTPQRSTHASSSGGTPTQLASRVDAVITPMSYQRVQQLSPGSPQSDPYTVAERCGTEVLNFLRDSYDVDSGTFTHNAWDVENNTQAAAHRDHLGQLTIQLLQCAEEVMRQEPLLARIPRGDCHVLGDVHGNYQDLDWFLRRMLPFGALRFYRGRLLFLGDYVDRGQHGVECLLRLLAMKVLAPQKVVLLRGNHEDPAICGDVRTYGEESFKRQCLRLFGVSGGEEVFRAACRVFAHLPLAAVIDNKVFCSHGGIPRFWRTDDVAADRRLQLLERPGFPRHVSLFSEEIGKGFAEAEATQGEHAKQLLEREWVLQYDLMWSDPVRDESAATDQHGFGRNDRGDSIVSFSKLAVETFLANNGFDMMIRAHQEKRAGLRLSQSNKVLTVFSSSNYQQHGNSAGAVFVREDGRMQLLMKRCAQPTG